MTANAFSSWRRISNESKNLISHTNINFAVIETARQFYNWVLYTDNVYAIISLINTDVQMNVVEKTAVLLKSRAQTSSSGYF